MHKYIFLVFLCGYSFTMDRPRTYDKSATDKLKAILDSLWVFTHPCKHNNEQTKKVLVKEAFLKAKDLILAGADPNVISIEKYPSNEMPILEYTIERDMVEESESLIELGANPNFCTDSWSVLSLAVSMKALKCVELLLKKGADINLGGGEGSPLYMAVRKGDYSTVKRFMKIGADIHGGAQSPWLCSAKYGDVRMFQLLLHRNLQINVEDKYGNNALITVAGTRAHNQRENDLQISKMLLDQGINLNHCANSGYSAVWCAANANKLKIVNLLLTHGADPNHACDKHTALMSAIRNGSVSMVQDLLYYGADQTMINENGQRAIDIARERGQDEIVDLLLMKKIA